VVSRVTVDVQRSVTETNEFRWRMGKWQHKQPSLHAVMQMQTQRPKTGSGGGWKNGQRTQAKDDRMGSQPPTRADSWVLAA
jgi:hypothetical protein